MEQKKTNQTVLNKKKEYYLENKSKILEKQKKYRESLNEEQKNHKKEVRQEYYAFNLEKISERRKERYNEMVTCKCGLEVHKPNLERHKQTQKHFKELKYLKQRQMLIPGRSQILCMASGGPA